MPEDGKSFWKRAAGAFVDIKEDVKAEVVAAPPLVPPPALGEGPQLSFEERAKIAISDQLWVLGRELGADGLLMPGARIQRTVNLLERGLAWRPEVEKLPAYTETVREVEDLFRGL